MLCPTRIIAYGSLRSARPFVGSVARRSIVTSPIMRMAGELNAAKPNQNAAVGAEGAHRNDSMMAASKVDHGPGERKDIHGDWVLFHPVYTPDEMHAVNVLHREPKTISDKMALIFVTFLRKSFDWISRYKHKPMGPETKTMSVAELRRNGYVMDPRQWLNRILFLESVAGVPGMVGAMIRHLQSLRLMKRDSGWIHTLLEEAENERLHLMTFMTLKNPSIWFRALVLGAQGVFFNAFFLSYILSPKTCHRFVGFLEEEAVITYTRIIEEIELGRLPEWENLDAPAIAKDYWRLPPNANMLDVLYAVRSDESTHRFVNHTLANLDNKRDINPFAIREPNMFIKGQKDGFSREESEKYVKESLGLLKEQGVRQP
ncbi:hypothetical protein M422DRAFT_24624 [Sphaerobolus stellatus SS14]|nr:hypothetical protein M422DRAFT_24624 [Sphaerobolus stellatus SS14]